MSSRNTRIDIQVNTQQARNNLRELAQETARVNNIQDTNNSQSNSQQQPQNRSLENQRIEINRQADELRRDSTQRLDNRMVGAEHRYSSMLEKDSSDEGRKKADEYLDNAITRAIEEHEEEQRQISEKTNELLERLVQNQEQQQNEETISRQRDSSEYDNDEILRRQAEERNGGRNLPATTEQENSSNRGGLGGGSDDFGTGLSNTVIRGAGAASSVMNTGDVIQGGLSMVGGLGPWGAAAAAIGASIYGAVKLINGRENEINGLTHLRALGDRDVINENIQQNDQIIMHGMSVGDYLNKRAEFARTSGRYEAASSENVINVTMLERGFGIEGIAGMSAFERQDSKGNLTADNILKMLNVLTEIKESGLSNDNFILANEKAQTFNALYSDFAGRGDKVNADSVISLMAAFNSLGGAGSDHRSTNFIQGTLGAMREGGDDNMMALKYQFALDARPDLANSQAGLARIVEQGTDPRYWRSTLKGLKNIAGNNSDMEYFLYKQFFGSNLTADMRDQLVQAGANPDFLSRLVGNNSVGPNNEYTQTYDKAREMSYDKTRFTEQLSGEFKKLISDALMELKSINKNTTPATIKFADKNNTITGNVN